MAITATQVKVFADSAGTQLVATFAGTTASTQTVAVTGLNPLTTYYVRAYATDDNNLTGESPLQSFQTAATSYTFTGSVTLSQASYDTLEVDILASCAGATFTLCGIEFNTSSDFSGTSITASNNGNDFVDDVSGFSENTTYYYRYFATTVEYGGPQYFVPQNNSITTNYAQPVVTTGVDAGSLSDTSATFWVNYAGNYPPSNLSLTITPSGGQAVPIQIQNMSGMQTGISAGFALTPNTSYTLSVTAGYYQTTVSGTYTFTTYSQRPTVAISGITNVTPSSADISITVS